MKKKIKKRGVVSAVYDGKNALHNFLFLLVAVLLCFSLFAMRRELCDNTYNYIAYEKDAYVWQSPHVKQFDAFLKGQLHLDVEASDALLALENPYDTAARNESGAEYLWDHAFYGGKYYSYFGTAPLIFVHLPIYIMTGGVPSDSYATMVLAVWAVLFLLLAWREAVLRFAPKANLWLFLFGAVALTAASGVYTSVYFADFYYVPVVSALCFTMAAVFFALRAFRKSSLLVRCICFVLCALSLAMAVLSRPSAALVCAALVPLFAVHFFEGGRKNMRNKLISACAFVLPLAACAGAVMWYNAARFSSPLDFGANWQLTVSNVAENTMERKFAFSSFFSYFLYPFWESEGYPFLKMQGQLLLPDGTRYIYGELYVGAFALVLPAAVLLYPRLARAQREAGERTAAMHSFAAAAMLAATAVAFTDFCKAGVNMRYVYDIVPMLSLVGALALVSMPTYFKGAKRVLLTVLCAVAFAAAMHAGAAVIYTFIP